MTESPLMSYTPLVVCESSITPPLPLPSHPVDDSVLLQVPYPSNALQCFEGPLTTDYGMRRSFAVFWLA